MAKTTAWVFGVIFVIVGVWGFFAQPAVGFVAADWLSSLVHLVIGVVLLALAAKPSVVVTLKTVGIIYVVLAILGFFQGTWVLFGIFATDQVTNWFYLVVGIVVAALGFSSKGSDGASPVAPQM
ncbi:MAG: DUF4383 domain-containing protein [Candidatus Taylorbacteria bacterium]|nr:DUF4383 domain-containing protein [Candidatus Taylorbacteria bacterium]